MKAAEGSGLKLDPLGKCSDWVAREADMEQTALGAVTALALLTPETASRFVTEVGAARALLQVADQ